MAMAEEYGSPSARSSCAPSVIEALSTSLEVLARADPEAMVPPSARSTLDALASDLSARLPNSRYLPKWSLPGEMEQSGVRVADALIFLNVASALLGCEGQAHRLDHSSLLTSTIVGLGLGLAAPFILDIGPLQAAWALASGSGLLALTRAPLSLGEQETVDAPLATSGRLKRIWDRTMNVGSRVAVGATTSGVGALIGAGLTTAFGLGTAG